MALGAAMLAAAGAQAMTAPANATDRLGVHISGHVTAKCGLAATGSQQAAFGALTDMATGSAAPAALELPFDLACNAPYSAVLTSRHGGLAFEGGATSGFASSIGYTATLGMTSGSGALALTCASSEMIAAGNAASGRGGRCAAASRSGASGQGRVRLVLKAGGPPLLKGVYSDELVLRVSPDLGGAASS